MFCPKCSQQQAADEVRFCSRCGFPLGGVKELLPRGPRTPAPAPTPFARRAASGRAAPAVCASSVRLLRHLHHYSVARPSSVPATVSRRPVDVTRALGENFLPDGAAKRRTTRPYANDYAMPAPRAPPPPRPAAPQHRRMTPPRQRGRDTTKLRERRESGRPSRLPVVPPRPPVRPPPPPPTTAAPVGTRLATIPVTNETGGFTTQGYKRMRNHF